MKYKMTAVLVALAMMFAGVFVMANGDGTDAGVAKQILKFELATTGTDVEQLEVNERSYSESYAVSFAWTVKTTDSSNTAVDVATGLDNIKYTVTAVGSDDKTKGYYSVTATSENAATGGYKHSLLCTATVTVDSKTIVLDVLEYKMEITVVAAVSPTALNKMSAEANVPFGEKVASDSVTDSSRGNYYWYALKLPAGIGMSRDGVVSGLATAESSATDYTVYAVEKGTVTDNPKTLSYTLNFEVKAKVAGAVKVTFSGDAKLIDGTTEMTFTPNATATSATVTPTATAYAEEGKTDAKFSIAAVDGTATAVNVLKVTSVGTDGAETVLSETSGTYTLDTNGTGEYKTKIYANIDGQSAVLIFNFLVLENLHGDWAPAIVINGN